MGLITYNQIKNQNVKQLASTISNLIIGLADASIIIHNAAVEKNVRDELETEINKLDPQLKQVWRDIIKVDV